MNQRSAQADAVLVKFDWDVPHCRQVGNLAVTLFDQLTALHNLGAPERDLLEAAALLHDIGWTVSHDKHHKHSYRLIQENRQRLSNFTATEVVLVANIARYHRKSLPALKHEAFATLPAADREVVRKLAALLRIADGLDRPHRQQVQKFTSEITDTVVTLRLQVRDNPEAHRTGGERKSDLFEQVYRRRLVVLAAMTG